MTVETRWLRRRHLIVFALAAVSFLVIAGLLLLSAASRGDNVPQPAAHEDRYAAIMVRGAWPASPDGLDVVAVLADGRERTVAHLDRTKMPNEVGAMVSASGWLALADDKPAGSRSWMLIDLLGRAAPDRCMGGTNDQAGPGIPAGEAFVTVQSDPRTAWTIVIYDPTPPRRR